MSSVAAHSRCSSSRPVRSAARVADDVRQGYVTIQGARDDNDTVIDPNTFQTDEAASTALRNKLNSQPK